MKTTIIKDISFRHFEGTATPMQKKMMEQWLQDSENIELYYQWLNEWENLHPQFIPDNKKAFKSILQKKLSSTTAPLIVKRQFFLNRLLYIKSIAAITILCVLSIGILMSKDQIFNKKVQTAFGEIRSLVLPDGTVVIMNANSTISYPRFGFGTKKRAVFLTGEADFSVTHLQNNQQFIVKTGKNLEIVVLGTQFTVFTRQEDLSVVLKKGKVLLNYESGNTIKKIILKPGDLFIARTGGINELRNIPNPENLSAWKNHNYLFEGTSIREIARLVKNNYGVDLKFQNFNLADRKITGTFHADTIDELLNVIAETLGLGCNKGENEYYFYERF